MYVPCLICMFYQYVFFYMVYYYECAFFIPFYYVYSFIINTLTFYSLFNAGSLSMGKGKADGTGLLSKLAAKVSRSGRQRSDPPRLLDDESSQ